MLQGFMLSNINSAAEEFLKTFKSLCFRTSLQVDFECLHKGRTHWTKLVQYQHYRKTTVGNTGPSMVRIIGVLWRNTVTN